MNKFSMQIDAKIKNVGFIRDAVAAFLIDVNPTLSELSDIKTAISEAATNCVVHGYNGSEKGTIYIDCEVDNDNFKISIADDGIGIKDIEKARQPFFTTKPNADRSGMGFTIMETFMDSLDVQNRTEGGLVTTMSKSFNASGMTEEVAN